MSDLFSIISIVLSIIALILSVTQYFIEHKRRKRQSTLEEYSKLQDEVFTQLNSLRKELPTINAQPDFEKRDEITVYLSKIERFCVGVNYGIYDLDTIRHCGGAYFVRQFDYLKPVIDNKRTRNNGGTHYTEFENVAESLRYYYKKSGDPVREYTSINKSNNASMIINGDETEDS